MIKTPHVRASAWPIWTVVSQDRHVQLQITREVWGKFGPLVSTHVLTVPEARRLYNTLQDALNVIDTRS